MWRTSSQTGIIHDIEHAMIFVALFLPEQWLFRGFYFFRFIRMIESFFLFLKSVGQWRFDEDVTVRRGELDEVELEWIILAALEAIWLLGGPEDGLFLD